MFIDNEMNYSCGYSANCMILGRNLLNASIKITKTLKRQGKKKKNEEKTQSSDIHTLVSAI